MRMFQLLYHIYGSFKNHKPSLQQVRNNLISSRSIIIVMDIYGYYVTAKFKINVTN